MKVFRIAPPHRIEDLSGYGAELFGGRWNSPGNPVLYTSASISLAMLEVLAGSDPECLKQAFKVATIHLPEKISLKRITTNKLPSGWNAYPHSRATQHLGDDWLEQASAAILEVPSAVNPLESNYLINPSLVNEEEIEITGVQELKFDRRFVL